MIGNVTEAGFALVHTQVPMGKAKMIPKAKAAVDKEWNDLIEGSRRTGPAFDFKSVRPRREVIAEAQETGKKKHFATVMDFGHENNSEMMLRDDQKVYKGRVVLRGDNVKEEDGFYALFSEQGSSSSQLEAGKAMDAISRAPGCAGEVSDALKAYTQVPLALIAKLLKEDYVETGIKLPRDRRPKEWDDIDDPVCLLRVNLYGHPLAGLYWEKFCQHQLFAIGFKKVPGWECLYVHKEAGLFLSIYVDDFQMAGKEASLEPMWKKLGEKLELEPAVPMDGNVYLGCGQQNVATDLDNVKMIREAYYTIYIYIYVHW